MTQRPTLGPTEPALERFAKLGLGPQARLALRDRLTRFVAFAPREELQREGKPITECRLIISGWGACVRFLPDGRRQLLNFLLPGDLIGFYQYEAPLAACSVVALTQLELCTVSMPVADREIENAFHASRAMDEAYLLAQITRIGRLSAQERLCDLLLELHDRLIMCGLANPSSFAMPLTQEVVADAVGLTPVHLNRMVQQARKAGDLEWKAGRITFRDARQLAESIGRLRVTTVAPPRAQSAFDFVS